MQEENNYLTGYAFKKYISLFNYYLVTNSSK